MEFLHPGHLKYFLGLATDILSRYRACTRSAKNVNKYYSTILELIHLDWTYHRLVIDLLHLLEN